jgi:hypothetical protein
MNNIKPLSPKQQIQEDKRLAKAKIKQQKEDADERIKKQEAVRTIKKVLNIYKTNFKDLLKLAKKEIPAKGISTKALHTILGTKIKQKPKECNHCHIKTENNTSLCNECKKIPKCDSCEIIMGYWEINNDTKEKELRFTAFDKPSHLKPTICEGCYEIEQEEK